MLQHLINYFFFLDFFTFFAFLTIGNFILNPVSEGSLYFITVLIKLMSGYVFLNSFKKLSDIFSVKFIVITCNDCISLTIIVKIASVNDDKPFISSICILGAILVILTIELSDIDFRPLTLKSVKSLNILTTPSSFGKREGGSLAL